MPLAFVTRRHSSTAWPALRARDICIATIRVWIPIKARNGTKVFLTAGTKFACQATLEPLELQVGFSTPVWLFLIRNFRIIVCIFNLHKALGGYTW